MRPRPTSGNHTQGKATGLPDRSLFHFKAASRSTHADIRPVQPGGEFQFLQGRHVSVGGLGAHANASRLTTISLQAISLPRRQPLPNIFAPGGFHASRFARSQCVVLSVAQESSKSVPIQPASRPAQYRSMAS